MTLNTLRVLCRHATPRRPGLAKVAFREPVDVVVSCLASRTGGKKDSWDIDYQATKNAMDAGRAAGAKHFVLLSAICVQKPLLEFQRAKLKFESDLQVRARVPLCVCLCVPVCVSIVHGACCSSVVNVIVGLT